MHRQLHNEENDMVSADAEYMRQWRKTKAGMAYWERNGRTRNIEYLKTLRETDRAGYNMKARKWRKKNRIITNFRNRIKHASLRTEALMNFGGRCSCCGETELDFLTVEHINHNSPRNPYTEWEKLKMAGWPKNGYTVLCMNCNWVER